MPNLFAALAKWAMFARPGDKRVRCCDCLQPLEISSVYITPIVMAGR
jgi:hypothetical protein